MASLWRMLFGTRQGGSRCANCAARVLQTDKSFQCQICARDPKIATRRRLAAAAQKAKGIVNPKCAKCGVSEAERLRQLQAAKARGVLIIGAGGPVILYCENCDKYFCGRCQTDLGFDSGCPECNANLEV